MSEAELRCRLVPLGMKSSKIIPIKVSKACLRDKILSLAYSIYTSKLRKESQDSNFSDRFSVLWYNVKLKGYVSFNEIDITEDSVPSDCIECLIGIFDLLHYRAKNSIA